MTINAMKRYVPSIRADIPCVAVGAHPHGMDHDPDHVDQVLGGVHSWPAIMCAYVIHVMPLQAFM